VKARTPGATKVLGTGGLLLTAALGWVFVVGPQVSALAGVRLDIEETRGQNVVLGQQLALLKQQSLELGETRSVARGLAARFPPTADLPELFRTVTDAAVDAGIGARGVTTLAPSAPVVPGTDPSTGLPLDPGSEPTAARQTVSVSVTGTYLQTEKLLENLEQMTRAYLITSLTLAAGEEPGTFLTAITGDMFVMAPLTPPDDAHDDSETAGG
jgi:Tfp pilus assembly protein PilO